VVVLAGWFASSAVAGVLAYGGGPVVHSSRPYVVFWAPSGESIPADTESLVERFFVDAAADSGKSSNVFGVLRQYYDRAGFADYRQTFDPQRQVIIDTQPYPARDTLCPDVGATYPTCITDLQIQAELQRLITADRLPTAGRASSHELSAGAPIYFVVLPSDVTICRILATLCGDKVGAGCAYHGVFADNSRDLVLYAPILTLCHATIDGIGGLKFDQFDGTALLQEPDGNPADPMLTPISHELSETITDPLITSWITTHTHLEAGDLCAASSASGLTGTTNSNAYLPTLGGSAAAGTLFDQLINGHPYYIQSEWSNGDGTCEMRPTAGRIAPRFVLRGRRRAGGSVVFNPAASKFSNALSSATWSFGDGSPSSFSSARAALDRVSHSYRRAGRYPVTLTLVDDRGNLKTTTRTVVIK
jgi:hypothetical protein